MKTNLKENKGITLIALIITIIVLLILAVVAISAVNEGDLFAHANNAATRYNAAATEENALLTNYLSEMAKYDGDGVEVEEVGIPGKYYPTGNINSEDRALTFSSETVTGEKFNDETISDVTWVLNGDTLTISYKEYEKGSYSNQEDTYTYSEDGLLFTSSGYLKYIKNGSANTHVNFSLLNGMSFQNETNSNDILTISNNGTIEVGNDELPYVCYNGKAYIEEITYTINYDANDNIISLTKNGVTYNKI